MSVIIRSRVTQYRLIIEDEVQAGRQALTRALKSRPRQPGWLPYFRLFFHFFFLSPPRSLCHSSGVSGAPHTLIRATLMRLCYFSPYPWQLDPGPRHEATFSIRVNRSQASRGSGMRLWWHSSFLLWDYPILKERIEEALQKTMYVPKM